MKAHIRKRQPELVTILETNRRFGYGYQGRMIMEGVVDSVIDSKPFTLYEAMNGMRLAIEEINKKCGYHYDPRKVTRISQDALQANKGRDFASAKLLQDIERGECRLSTPAAADCIRTGPNDEDIAISGRGLVKFAYLAWMDDNLPKARAALKRYCEYVTLHGHGGGAAETLAELDAMDKDAGIEWVERTYARYVADGAAMMNYVMGGTE